MHTYLRFDAKGKLTSGSLPTPPAGATDLVILSHGWNNDDKDSRDLYDPWSEGIRTRLAGTGREPWILCVRWPSKKFNVKDDAPLATAFVGGAQSVGGAPAVSETASAIATVEELRELFTEPAEITLLDEAARLAPTITADSAARLQFVETLRALAPEESQAEDAATGIQEGYFLHLPPSELISAMKVPVPEPEDDAMLAGAAPQNMFIGGAANAVLQWPGRIGNYLTVFTMKTRAGIVGEKGLAPLLPKLAAQPGIQRITLVGHSFGARLLTATVAAAASEVHAKIHALCLFQAAFSHNAFSEKKNGGFRKIIDQGIPKVPIRITHTIADRANAVAYPLAMRISQDSMMSFGGANDRFGALGANGAVQMNPGEAHSIPMPADGAAYPAPGTWKILNVKANKTQIPNHFPVTTEPCNHLIAEAILSD